MSKPLRVAVFTDTFPSVSETFIARQIAGLLDLRHRVRVYSDSRPDATSLRQNGTGLGGLRVRATYFRIPQASGYWEMPAFPPWGRTWLPGHTVPVANAKRLLYALPVAVRCLLSAPRLARKSLDFAEYGYRARSLSTLYRLSQLLHGKGKFDIAHAHFGPVGDNVRFVRELWGVPLIVSFHGYDVGAWPREKSNTVYNNLFRAADMVTANSRYTAGQLESLGCPPRKIHVLHMGLNLSRFAFRERMMPDNGRIAILSVGRLVEKKGFEYAIRAVARVREKHPGVEYGIVGDGTLREHLQEVACELGLGEVMTFHGAGSEDLVLRKMQEAHLFLVPSVTASDGDTEGQGLVLQEAQACGLPVLATNHDGLPEGMLQGLSGFLVPERSIEALAERLAYMIEHPRLWPAWGREGRKYIEEHYDIRALNMELERLYRQAILSYNAGEQHR